MKAVNRNTEKRIKTNKVLRHNRLPKKVTVTQVTEQELRERPYRGMFCFK